MIGGYAYNLYRNPRATGDIDFFLASDDTNEQRFRSVLQDFGFGETLSSDRLLIPDRVIMLGRAPFRVDVITNIDGVSFEEAEADRRLIQVGDLNCPVISPQLLLKNKLASARPKDLADAAELQAWLDNE